MTRTWDSLHPFVVHFPVALLVTAPFMIILALLFGAQARTFLLSALVLVVGGTAGIFLGVSTGEAAALAIETSTAEADLVIDQHQELAEQLRPLFALLTLSLGVVVSIWPRIVRWRKGAATVTLVVFLAIYAGASAVLVRTAHSGGRLVHEFGIHARLPGAPQQ